MAFENRLIRKGAPPKTGIVHLGPGAFFRAFNAVYTQDALDAKGGDWGIAAVSLRSNSAQDQLAPQGHAFTSVTLEPGGEKARIISSISDVLVAPDNPRAVIDLMTSPSVKIVSLTITEKGYGYDPASGGLDVRHPDIAEDLRSPNAPRSAVGLITAALQTRRQKGIPAFTVLSCDNLPSNGKVARAVVTEYANQADPALAAWIADNVCFPSTMVDRITPATTDADLDRLEHTTGYRDEAAVFHEPFRQWVIEDQFTMGRPAWDAGGAQFVDSVEAHELMKLRCLNGTHSALAYLGYLAGHETIADAVADDVFARLCRHLWQSEILPTVPQPQGENLEKYTDALMQRYTNPNIRHRTWQIAMDGSQKLPQRILGTIAENLQAGNVPLGLCLVVAAWMRYVGGTDESGRAIDVRDPMADRLKQAWNSSEDAAKKTAAFLTISEVFDPSLARNPTFAAAVTSACRTLLSKGARHAVANYVSGK